MSRTSDVNTPLEETIHITEADLPLYCPGPKAPLWSMHPRVYIEIEKDKQALCPYCSAKYHLDATPPAS